MEQVKLIGANIIPSFAYVTKSPGEVVETKIHWQCTVPTGTHTFYLWSIFGKNDYPEPGTFAFMTGAFGFAYGDVGTGDWHWSVLIELGKYGEIANGDWDCLLLICETDDFLTGYIYDGGIVLDALTITGAGVLEAQLIEAGFY